MRLTLLTLAVFTALPLLGLPFTFCCCAVIPGVLATIFWIWMLVDCIQYETSDKLVWVLVVIFLHGLGALLYFLIRYNKNRLPGPGGGSGGGGGGMVV